MIPEWQQGIVKRVVQATANTRQYWIELQGTQSFLFKAGQFVTFDLPIHEQRNRRWRSYSIASVPDGGNLIELVIVYVDGGAASAYFFDTVKEGMELTLRGPHGLFVLPPEMDRNMCFICTGTGIAPFRSMLNYIKNNNVAHKKIDLIFGTRTKADLLYADELTALQKDIPGYTYHPVLSREEWDGYKGYVHAVYETLCCDLPPTSFMLCGWRAMVDEAKQRIMGLGYEKKDIHQELYG
ncbi:MAG: FAD-dependent oxidoreductase [Taibaiella sp.]|nr:FAD-dependent oxidoreductase [Taibaiella sp.]